MLIIWLLIISFFIILIFLAIKGKKILFKENNVKPNWIKYFLFSYTSILIMPLVFFMVTYFLDNIYLLFYFLEIEESYTLPDGLKIFSDVISFLFSLSYYILSALLPFSLLFNLKHKIKFIVITVFYLLIFPFTWSMSLRLVGYYIGIQDIGKLVDLEKVMFIKITYIHNLFGPTLGYTIILIIFLFISYSNRDGLLNPMRK